MVSRAALSNITQLGIGYWGLKARDWATVISQSDNFYCAFI